jgi:hypothetical protein
MARCHAELSIEETIGMAAATAVGALCNAMLDYMVDGRLSAGNRARGAEAIAELYALQRDNPLIEFEDVARGYGKKSHAGSSGDIARSR